jgi:hypothetical protein
VDKSTECDPSILLPEGKLGCLLSYDNLIG